MVPNPSPTGDEPDRDWAGGPSPDDIREAAASLIALVDQRLPERFYVRSEPHWRLGATAMVARMAGLVDTVIRLLPAQRPSDTAIVIRALYEYVVTTCWLLIDPTERVYDWADAARREYLTLRREATRYGVEPLTDEQVERATGLSKLPPLAQRALEVDQHYGARVAGFHAADSEGTLGLLTFYGMYSGLYRTASVSQHANIVAIDACLDASGYPWRVHLEENDDIFWASLAVPLFALGLLAVADRLGWPDADEVRRINDRMHGTAVD